MDPVTATIIAAVVNASGTVLTSVIGLFANREIKGEEQARQVIDKTYETLKGNLTGGSVQVLKQLEGGSLLYSDMLRKRLYPDLSESPEFLRAFDAEFRYRLEYLIVNGVITFVPPSEYGISRLGRAYLEEARRRKDYPDQL
jgi:hypothetical protein